MPSTSGDRSAGSAGSAKRARKDHGAGRCAGRELVHVIEPNAVYFPEQVRRIFRLGASTIRAERRAGRLRLAKRAGRYYLLGKWLLEWIESGEIPSLRDRELPPQNGELPPQRGKPPPQRDRSPPNP